VNVLICIKPLVFGACIELRLSFGTSNVLHCKNPLIFSACVQLCLSFRTADVLHVENLLYLSLVLNLFFESALLMNCIAKNSYIGRLWGTATFVWHYRCAALQKTLIFGAYLF